MKSKGSSSSTAKLDYFLRICIVTSYCEVSSLTLQSKVFGVRKVDGYS